MARVAAGAAFPAVRGEKVQQKKEARKREHWLLRKTGELAETFADFFFSVEVMQLMMRI